jgi:hypothetical protein
MEKIYQRLALRVRHRDRQVRCQWGVMVQFKGCITEARFDEIVAKQKERDRQTPPPPNPTDRDGAWRASWQRCFG